MSQIIKFSLLFMLFAGISYADQTITASNNDTINIRLSRYEISRIAFTEDIASIHAIQGEMEYEIQGQNIFIRSESSKPINFFITTEKDNNYKFLANIENIQATQIFIKTAREQGNKIDVSFSEAVSDLLQENINKLIDFALSPRPYLSYSITEQNKKLPSLQKDLTMHLTSKLGGNGLFAEKIRITNQGEEAIALSLRDFMSPDYLAFYLSKDLLVPFESAYLIRIKEEVR